MGTPSSGGRQPIGPRDPALADTGRVGPAELAAAVTESSLPRAPAASTEVPDARPGDPDPLPRGAVLGRYVVLDRIGAGGMGVVYAAYDPELDRKIALKLLRIDSAGAGGGGQLRARLLREAQAMARLSHPSVISVLDVGTFADRVFVAMEYVDGVTLGRWLAERPRPWREVLAVLARAGRGLAAAHAAGLLHRDFKPDNVLIGSDGRVRVVDFGLARPPDAVSKPQPGQPDPAAEAAPARSRLASGTLDGPLTMSGAVMGTPVYMAPEQYRGAPLDTRIDQFSFCVALYEGLYGERPFAGTSAASLCEAIEAGAVRDAPRGSRVPAWLRRVVLRGLRGRPAERYPSMTALLAALARDPRVARRGWLVGGGGAALLAALLAAWQVGRRPPPPPCEGAAARLAGIWDGPRRRAVEDGLLATGAPYAADAWRGVATALDGYAASWTAMRTEACEATAVRREQSAALLDRRMMCLDRRLRELDELAGLLATADPELARGAVAAARTLTPLDECADAERLMAGEAPARGRRKRELNQLDAWLARAKALGEAGQYQAARDLAVRAVNTARTRGHGPSEVRALLILGSAYQDGGDLEAAERTLTAAALAADRIGADTARAQALIELIYAVGYVERDFAAGARYAGEADAVLARLGPQPLLEASLHNNVGSLVGAQGRHDESLDHHRKALAIRERLLGGDHPAVASSLNNIGTILYAQQHSEEALAFQRRALVIRERAFGSRHPLVAVSLINIGAPLVHLGLYDEALPHYQRALGILEEALGGNHPHVAIALHNLGDLYDHMKQYDRALAYYERALVMDERIHGPDAPPVAYMLHGMGTAYLGLDQPARAVAPLERALGIRERAHVDPVDIAATRFVLARALWARAAARPRALALARSARATFEELGTRPQSLREVMSWLAER